MYGYGNSMFLATHGILARTNAAVLPVNTVAPALSGTAQEGQTLTCSTGTWTGTPTITYSYQWKRNNVNIGSATNSTYTLVTADVGQSIKCTVTATNGAGSVNADSNTVTPTSAVDPDAQAFITAAGITDNTQKSAINQLVVDLKGYSIWTKMKALYPFVGGTSSTHKWNLKDPRDLDAAFRILWSGGVTHSANGVQFGGVNGYGNTKLTPSSALTLNSNHLSVYSRTNVAEGKIDFGVQDDSVAGRLIYLATRNGSSNFISAITCLDPDRVIASNTDARGFYLGSRSSSTSLKGYKNGTLQGTNTTAAIGSQASSFIALGALNYPLTSQVINYSSKELAFASVGDALNDTEAANFYTAVQAFQTTLGRQV